MTVLDDCYYSVYLELFHSHTADFKAEILVFITYTLQVAQLAFMKQFS